MVANRRNPLPLATGADAMHGATRSDRGVSGQALAPRQSVRASVAAQCAIYGPRPSGIARNPVVPSKHSPARHNGLPILPRRIKRSLKPRKPSRICGTFDDQECPSTSVCFPTSPESALLSRRLPRQLEKMKYDMNVAEERRSYMASVNRGPVHRIDIGCDRAALKEPFEAAI